MANNVLLAGFGGQQLVSAGFGVAAAPIIPAPICPSNVAFVVSVKRLGIVRAEQRNTIISAVVRASIVTAKSRTSMVAAQKRASEVKAMRDTLIARERIIKRAVETWPVGVDFEDVLAGLPVQEVIDSGGAFAITDESAHTALTFGAVNVLDDYRIWFNVSGGTSGEDHKIRVSVTADSGATRYHEIMVLIRDE